eukprot:427116-Pyramimonas_sp.AAC.1
MERLWWCSTVDMLADAMTKGACAREPLLDAVSSGRGQLTKPSKSARLRLGCTPIRGSSEPVWGPRHDEPVTSATK